MRVATASETAAGDSPPLPEASLTGFPGRCLEKVPAGRVGGCLQGAQVLPGPGVSRLHGSASSGLGGQGATVQSCSFIMSPLRQDSKLGLHHSTGHVVDPPAHVPWPHLLLVGSVCLPCPKRPARENRTKGRKASPSRKRAGRSPSKNSSTRLATGSAAAIRGVAGSPGAALPGSEGKWFSSQCPHPAQMLLWDQAVTGALPSRSGLREFTCTPFPRESPGGQTPEEGEAGEGGWPAFLGRAGHPTSPGWWRPAVLRRRPGPPGGLGEGGQGGGGTGGMWGVSETWGSNMWGVERTRVQRVSVLSLGLRAFWGEKRGGKLFTWGRHARLTFGFDFGAISSTGKHVNVII